jgi:DNA-binding NtrC family response regulator
MAEKIRIMIVDDEERFLNTLAQRLRLRDFEVAAFSNGQEAVETARREEFDLAIVDLKMPGMTGEQVLELIKEHHPLTEVIILTGHGSIPSAVHCTQVGSYNYLQKPCETDELLEVIKNAYHRRVQRKLQLNKDRMDELLCFSMGESPLGILRRLKEMDKQKA